MANPTFVDVINDIRQYKRAFGELHIGMSAMNSRAGSESERIIAKSVQDIGVAMEARMQELSVAISKLAINHSQEDVEKIMEAMSK